MPKQSIAWLNRIEKEDAQAVGYKAAELGEMTKQGFPVPPGFVITSDAFIEFIKSNKLDKKIKNILATVNFNHSHSISQASSLIKNEIKSSPVPLNLVNNIYEALIELNNSDFSIQLSTNLKNNPINNLKKHFELNSIRDKEENILDVVKNYWSNIYSELFIVSNHSNEYITNNFSVIIQKMIKPDKFGTILTLNPNTRRKNIIIIDSDLGSNNMLNISKPTYYEIEFSTNKIIRKPILSDKDLQLSGLEIKTLVNLGKKLEKFHFFPQIAEWAIEKNKLYILNSRPITNIAIDSKNLRAQL